MQDDILKEIREEYPTAVRWKLVEGEDRLLVEMTTLDMIGGIAGDIEIDGSVYALSRVFPLVYPGTDTAILVVTFRRD